jgi:sugar transferase EpsL
VIAAASSMPNRRRGLAAKRALDLVVALAGLVLIAPILVATALAVRIGLGRPVLFRQMRPGLGGRPFTLLKFRTMTRARDAAGQLLPDERRLTPLGRWLRRTSLDELPELINVLRGDMSLVGPRPLLMAYLPHYSPEQARRHEVRPGLTGWAAVNGRNATSWEQRLAQDVWYVDHRSFALDCRILLMTVAKVIRQEGISQDGHATMPRFDEELGKKA